MADLSSVKKDVKRKAVRLADMMKATAQQLGKTPGNYRMVKGALEKQGMGDSFSLPTADEVKTKVRRGWENLKDLWNSRYKGL